MAPIVEGAGVELNVVERGAGRRCCSSTASRRTPRRWRRSPRRSPREARVIAYDRRGYGASGAPEPYRGHDGRGAGAGRRRAAAARSTPRRRSSAATASARSSRSTSPSATARSCGPPSLSDPPLFMFVPEATERARRPARRARGGGARRRPAAGRRGLAGRRAPAPAALERARAAHRAFFADYAGLASWPVTRRELRALDLPAVVLTGPRSPPHVVAAADALAGLLPARARADDGDLVAAVRSAARVTLSAAAWGPFAGSREGPPPARCPARRAARRARGGLRRAGAQRARAPRSSRRGRPIELPVQVAPGLIVRVRDPYGGLIARNRLFVAFSIRYASAADRARVASVTWTLDGAAPRRDEGGRDQLLAPSTMYAAGRHVVGVRIQPAGGGPPVEAELQVTATDCQLASLTAAARARGGAVALASPPAGRRCARSSCGPAAAASAGRTGGAWAPWRAAGRPHARPARLGAEPRRPGADASPGLPHGTTTVRVRLAAGVVAPGHLCALRARLHGGAGAAGRTSCSAAEVVRLRCGADAALYSIIEGKVEGRPVVALATPRARPRACDCTETGNRAVPRSPWPLPSRCRAPRTASADDRLSRRDRRSRTPAAPRGSPAR